MFISIVIPCYNSQDTIGKMVDLITEEFDKNPGYSCEFILVNDYSADGTYKEIRRLAGERANVKGIDLVRNFGQHNALMAALAYADGDYVIGMDDDMQTHPSQIFKLVHKIEEGYDVVYGVYNKRKNSFLKNLSSKFNAITSRIFLGRPKEIHSSNFWIITQMVRREVVKYTSYNPYVDAIFYRITHNIGNIPIEHFKREVGTSNYTLSKLIRLWLAYWNYSMVPLRISSILGIVFAFGGFLSAVVIVVKKLLDPEIPTGWPSTICIMVTFFGLVLMVLGIIGEYLGKIILTLNHTPQYIIRETLNIESEKVKEK